MSPVRLFARPMLASMFVLGGIDAMTNPASKEPKARDVVPPLAEALPALGDLDVETVVRINGAAQVAGGTLLALGRMPRLASTVLAASLVPTTLAGHRYWEETDPAVRANQRIHFFKNVSMLGGLAIAAMDTEGRPGLRWRAQHAVEHAESYVDRTRREARLARKLAKAETKRRVTPDVADLARGVKRLRSAEED